eukprot:Skav209410  [mRNA]  locus=scaffold2187:150414:152573:+ [translate_table: standard]
MLISNHPDIALETKQEMHTHWKKLLEFEAEAAAGKFVPGMDALHFLKSSLTRVCFLLNEKDIHDGTSNASVAMKALVHHMGCASCVENTHQSAKDSLRQARHNQRSRIHKYKACIDAKILQSRQTPHVSISELELVAARLQDLPKVLPMTNPASHKMAKEFQLLMKHKSGKHFWPSTSAATQFEEVMAFEFLMHQGAGAGTHQLSCLVGDPGSIIIDQAAGKLMMVLGKTFSGFTGWLMDLESWDDGTSPGTEHFFFKPSPQKTALVFSHVSDLENFLEYPVEPALQNDYGALVLKQLGEPMHLVQARLQSGLDLTLKETKAVLAAHDIVLPGAPSKSDCYSRLMQLYAKTDQDMQEFLEKSKLKLQQDDVENDDDYQELLDLLEEDTENRNDPDVKQEKQKLKRKRLQHPKGLGEDQEPLKKPRGRGRGRGRGGGRGRGKQDAPETKDVKKTHRFGRGKRKTSKKEAKHADKKASSNSAIPEGVKDEIESVFNAAPLEAPNSPATPVAVLDPPQSPANPPVDMEDFLKTPERKDAAPGVPDLGQPSPRSPCSPGFSLEALLETPEKQVAKAETVAEPVVEPLVAGPASGSGNPPPNLEQSSGEADAEPASSSDTLPQPSVDPNPEQPPTDSQAPEPDPNPEQPPTDSQAPDPVQPGPKAPGIFRGPKVYSSPNILASISPPGCMIRLNRNWAAVIVLSLAASLAWVLLIEMSFTYLVL